MTDTTLIQERLKELVLVLHDKLGDEGIDPEMAEIIRYLRSEDLIKAHLTAITKDRSIILSGDVGHMSIENIIGTYALVDEPKKYDFQDDDCYEQDFLRSLLRCVPSYINRATYTQEEIVEALEGKEWLNLPAGHEYRCYDCGESLQVAVKGKEVRLTASKPCEHNRKFDIEVDFPTGEVVYADWPDRFSEASDAGFLITPPDGRDSSVNYIKGQRRSTDHYATQQIVHHFVGNSCPTFYVKNTNQIQIGGGCTYNEETDEYETIDGFEGFEDVGSFCTDLWWVTMQDRKFYDLMVAGLPKKRDAKYYEKSLTTTKIEPGRYRFTCFTREDDDSYMVGERIGDASDFVPTYNISDERVVMTVDEAVWNEVHRYREPHNGLVSVHNIERQKWSLMDMVFNGIGYGISSKGDFLKRFSKGKGEFITPVACQGGKVSAYNPYPNFKKQYSFVWRCEKLDFLPVEWIQGAIWYYEQCQTFFKNGAEGYSYAYPNTNEKQEDDFRAIITKLGTERSEEEWHTYVSKTYGGGKTPFTGDYEDWRKRSWEQTKADALVFIDETLKVLKKELDKRS